jgi:hypothetical protein
MTRSEAESAGWVFEGDETEQFVSIGNGEFRQVPGRVTAKKFNPDVAAYRELTSSNFNDLVGAIEAVETEVAARANADTANVEAKAAAAEKAEAALSQWRAVDKTTGEVLFSADSEDEVLTFVDQAFKSSASYAQSLTVLRPDALAGSAVA